MTSPEAQEARTRVLRAALGCGLAALAAVGALLALGLRNTDRNDIVVVAPRTTFASASGAQATRTAQRRSNALSAEIPQGRLFAPASFWNERLTATTALDPSSATLVQSLVAEVQREQAVGIGPWFVTSAGSTPVYEVRGGQPQVRVHLDPSSSRGANALRRAFASVPIPRSAAAAPGSDKHMTIWQPSSDQLWEFFGAVRRSDGWHARWGGAIRNVSKNIGYYTPAAWPGATRNWGATATSLPVIGGTVMLDELKRGQIDHALALNLPAPRATTFSWPAQRTDGTGPPTALPEGARLRLDPSLDVNSLHLPKLTKLLALAAQRYGLVVRDQTHHAIGLFGEVPKPGDTRAYQKYLKGKTPGQLLAVFPWDRLQVLQMKLCTAAPCRRG